jgi:hypothetical protein
MAAAAHDPKFAKKLGIKTSVAKEFNKADTGTKQLSNAMKKKKVKENEIPGHSMGFNPGPGGPGLMPNESHENQPDVVAMDVPLLIRIMEFAREDAKTDMDLHNVAERLIAMSEEGQTLTMDDYNAIMGQVDEARKIKPKRKTDPCWSNYHQVGMKKKDGKEVPNCVPRNSKLDELSNEKLGAYKAAAYNSARKADQEGKYSLGDKRFAGINKATNKQFANDLKKYTGK